MYEQQDSSTTHIDNSSYRRVHVQIVLVFQAFTDTKPVRVNYTEYKRK